MFKLILTALVFAGPTLTPMTAEASKGPILTRAEAHGASIVTLALSQPEAAKPAPLACLVPKTQAALHRTACAEQ